MTADRSHWPRIAFLGGVVVVLLLVGVGGFQYIKAREAKAMAETRARSRVREFVTSDQPLVLSSSTGKRHALSADQQRRFRELIAHSFVRTFKRDELSLAPQWRIIHDDAQPALCFSSNLLWFEDLGLGWGTSAIGDPALSALLDEIAGATSR